MKISSWGKYPRVEAKTISYKNPTQLAGEEGWIPRGMGRSYGDSALSDQLCSTLKLNRFLSFDEKTGLLYCESGVSYTDLLEHFVPKGWFPPVTPGTQFVSMGGAFASDVHGKNHHVSGTFSQHVKGIDLLLPSGEIVFCSRDEKADLFFATAGGMGLTGLILRLYIQLHPIETSAIALHSIKARNLDEIFRLFEEHKDATYSVAWIDTISGGKKLGRSILMLGEHASLEEVKGSKWEKDPSRQASKKSLQVPFDFPSGILNTFTIGAFNTLYYHKQFKKEIKKLVGYEGFFYPLDAIHHWNRIYGKKGFTQYQFVIPTEAGPDGIARVLERIRKARMGSFLSVLKQFGPASRMLSFPIEGYTLTLDFPIKKKLFPLLNELDEMVVKMGGRVYLTKDVRLSAEQMPRMYPETEDFLKVVREVNPKGAIRSIQSERLKLH